MGDMFPCHGTRSECLDELYVMDVILDRHLCPTRKAEVDNGKVDDDNNDNEDDDMDVADNEVHGGNNINDWGSSLDDDSRLISSSL
jgi:hypothetical protein